MVIIICDLQAKFYPKVKKKTINERQNKNRELEKRENANENRDCETPIS